MHPPIPIVNRVKTKRKTINAQFIRIRALSQLSFVQFRPYATKFPGLLLSLTLMPKCKKTRETSFDLRPSFKTSTEARVEGLVSNVDYLENRCRNFIQKKYAIKRCLPRTHVLFSELQFSFLYGMFIPLMAPKGKKRINKALSKKSKQFLLLFYFLV